MYDFIGDIHGEYDKLVELLIKLQYKKTGNTYSHPTRKVLFLGDLIDRGPKIKETLDLVISMTESGNAKCIMGNHEFNLICFHTPSRINSGHFLRDQTQRHTKQCQETFSQIPDHQLKHYLDWIKTLPFFLEDKNFRAVHAAWINRYIKILDNVLIDQKLNDQNIYSLFEDPEINLAMEITLKGPEIKLPKERHYKDADGNSRSRARFCWWDRSQIIMNGSQLDQNLPLDQSKHCYYDEQEKLVFFGHYWLKGSPSPFITSKNAQCLDFSVAKNGFLAAYRFDGQSTQNDKYKLQKENLIYV